MSRLATGGSIQGEGRGRVKSGGCVSGLFLIAVLLFFWTQVYSLKYTGPVIGNDLVPAWWKGTCEGFHSIFITAPRNMVEFVRNGGRFPAQGKD